MFESVLRLIGLGGRREDDAPPVDAEEEWRRQFSWVTTPGRQRAIDLAKAMRSEQERFAKSAAEMRPMTDEELAMMNAPERIRGTNMISGTYHETRDQPGLFDFIMGRRG